MSQIGDIVTSRTTVIRVYIEETRLVQPPCNHPSVVPGYSRVRHYFIDHGRRAIQQAQ